jgi:LysM repeat protein
MNKKISVRLISILALATVLVSACTQSYSQPPAATATLISTSQFVSPFPTGQDPMQIVAELGTATAIAKTAEASGTILPSETPAGPTDTPSVGGTAITPQTGESSTPPPETSITSTPAPATVIVTGSTATPQVVVPTVSGGLPTTYTLQAGEWPFCIARRFNVDPNELASLNGLVDSQIVQPGLVLQIPQTGHPFPGTRAWHNHPDTYTVTGNNDTTLFGVACYYGDIDPATIAQANNLPLNSTLTVGQQLTIP